MTDAERFCEAGRAMFGVAWLPDMAELLRINYRTCERLASGAKPVPDGMWAEIADAASVKAAALSTLSTWLLSKSA